jgi:hypothetical protein
MSCWVLPKIVGVSNGLSFVLNELLGSFREMHIFSAEGGLAIGAFHSGLIVTAAAGNYGVRICEVADCEGDICAGGRGINSARARTSKPPWAIMITGLRCA